MSLSPSLTVALTPCYCGMLGGLHVLVGSLTFPSRGRMFEPSCFGRLLCHEAGLTYRPSLHFRYCVSCLTCSRDSQLLRHPAIDIGGIGPVFLAFGCYRPLAIAVRLVVFMSWLAPSLIPHRDVCLGLPALDACCAMSLG